MSRDREKVEVLGRSMGEREPPKALALDNTCPSSRPPSPSTGSPDDLTKQPSALGKKNALGDVTDMLSFGLKPTVVLNRALKRPNGGSFSDSSTNE